MIVNVNQAWKAEAFREINARGSWDLFRFGSGDDIPDPTTLCESDGILREFFGLGVDEPAVKNGGNRGLRKARAWI